MINLIHLIDLIDLIDMIDLIDLIYLLDLIDFIDLIDLIELIFVFSISKIFGINFEKSHKDFTIFGFIMKIKREFLFTVKSLVGLIFEWFFAFVLSI